MSNITITLTEDQAICLIRGLESYKIQIKKNDWQKTGLVESEAFIRRLQNKLRQELN